MTDVPVFILAGQSNAEYAGIDNRIVERLMALGGTFEFVKRASGGTSLFTDPGRSDWAPTSSGELFSLLVADILAAAANVRAQGHNPVFTILWVQGETDRGNAAYGAQLTAFIAALRTAIGAPNAEFFISALPYESNARTGQLAVDAADPHAHLVETMGAGFWDGVHYDRATRNRIADTFMDAAAPTVPTIPGYQSLIPGLTQQQNGAYWEVQGPVWTDFTFVADNRHHRIFGGQGDDRITGGGGNDVIYTGGNDDVVIGGGGNDFIDLGHHDDIGYGGTGNDTIRGQSGSDVIYGEDGDDILEGGEQDDQLFGGAGNDSLNGSDGIDRLGGGSGDDTYYTNNAADLVFEGAGAGEGLDTVITTSSFYLYANIENLTLASAAGDIFGVGNGLSNLILGNEGANLLIAGDGNDTVRGGSGNDNIFGETGDDILNGDAGIDYLVGGLGNDFLWGGNNADALYGQDGNDVLGGGDDFATDIMVGGVGNDIFYGDSGLSDYDLMDGGAGDDRYYVDTGDDLTFEAAGGGYDTVYADIQVPNAGVYLYANVEALELRGTTAFGVGNELNNVLGGNDVANFLLGGAGNDIINGQGGNDVLFGEAGNDTFIFRQGTGGDVIGDFQMTGDRMDVSAFGFTSLAQIQIRFSQVGNDGAINLGGGDFIVLHGVTMANLTAAQFIFSAAGAPEPNEDMESGPLILPGATLEKDVVLSDALRERPMFDLHGSESPSHMLELPTDHLPDQWGL